MNAGDILIVFAIACIAWGVASAILMMAYLERRKVSVSLILSRLWLFKYIGQYRAITVSETGRPGGLFYSYFISMNLALIGMTAGLILK